MSNLPDSFFRSLDQKEEAEFRQWARDNFIVGETEINPVWHPVVRGECQLMEIEEERKNASSDQH